MNTNYPKRKFKKITAEDYKNGERLSPVKKTAEELRLDNLRREYEKKKIWPKPSDLKFRLARYTKENLLKEIELQTEYFLYTNIPKQLKDSPPWIPSIKKVIMYYFDSDELPFDNFIPAHVLLLPYHQLPFPSNFEEMDKLVANPEIPIIKTNKILKNNKDSSKPRIAEYFIHNEDFSFVNFKKIGKKGTQLRLIGMKAKIFQKLFTAYLQNDVPWVSPSVLLQNLITGYDKPSAILKGLDYKRVILVDKKTGLYRLNLPPKEYFDIS